MKRFTTETQRPRSETFREDIKSLWALCASVVNFVFIRVHSCPFAVTFIRVDLRSSAVELSLVLGKRSICGSGFLP
jgi:hypothetical protein